MIFDDIPILSGICRFSLRVIKERKTRLGLILSIFLVPP